MVFEGWRRHRALGRTLLVLFYTWMCFAAVYLDHHWVIDLVVGSAYALAVVFGMRRIDRWLRAAPSAVRISPSTEMEHEHG
jgi:membrane-associated phospholipid phosphatase